jgi:hypothetical protein
MFVRCLRYVLCWLVFSPLLAFGQMSAHVIVDVPTAELLDSYLAWAHKHPEVLSLNATGGTRRIELPLAFVELFAPDGTLIYRGTSDFENAAFIQKLATGIPSPIRKVDIKKEPSLADNLEMFKELVPFKSSLLNSRRYVLFVETYPNDQSCSAQNAALVQVKSFPSINIVEVRLRNGG